MEKILKSIELDAYLQREGLLDAHVGDDLKKYVPGSHVFINNMWKNMIDVFGIYQGSDGRYCFLSLILNEAYPSTL